MALNLVWMCKSVGVSVLFIDVIGVIYVLMVSMW